MTPTNHPARVLLPSTSPAPGSMLWGDAPRRQPIAPLVLMAALLLLVAAPSAFGGGGSTGNPMHLLRQVADATWEVTGLMQQSNGSLQKIDTNTAHVLKVQANMESIATSTASVAESTSTLDEQLALVQAGVGSSNRQLGAVDRKLAATAKTMAPLRTHVTGSVRSTQAIVREFSGIERSIGAMDTSLKGVIARMSTSAPLTASFANNRTRLAIAGGDPTRYGVRNLVPDNRVMTVALGMLGTMQRGGPLPARKDRHVASNIVLDTALRAKVPDGTNVSAIVQPYDGQYGVPGPQYFIDTKINGF